MSVLDTSYCSMSICLGQAKLGVEGRLNDQILPQQLPAHPLQLFIMKCIFNQREFTGHTP